MKLLVISGYYVQVIKLIATVRRLFGVLPRDQLSRNQLPLNQLPIDQLPTRSTPTKSTSHKINQDHSLQNENKHQIMDVLIMFDAHFVYFGVILPVSGIKLLVISGYYVQVNHNHTQTILRSLTPK